MRTTSSALKSEVSNFLFHRYAKPAENIRWYSVQGFLFATRSQISYHLERLRQFPFAAQPRMRNRFQFWSFVLHPLSLRAVFPFDSIARNPVRLPPTPSPEIAVRRPTRATRLHAVLRLAAPRFCDPQTHLYSMPFHLLGFLYLVQDVRRVSKHQF